MASISYKFGRLKTLKKVIFLKAYFLVFLTFCLKSVLFGQSNNLVDGDFTPGRCYVDINYREKIVNQEVFALASLSSRHKWKEPVVRTSIVEPKTKWVKKKADSNCLSSNPNDCIVWCLVEISGYHYFEVTDTVKYKNFATFYYSNDSLDLVKSKQWFEAVCPHRVTAVLKEEVQEFLISNNYLSASETDDIQLYKSICAFQRKNKFIVGMYDIETLYAMKLEHYILDK